MRGLSSSLPFVVGFAALACGSAPAPADATHPPEPAAAVSGGATPGEATPGDAPPIAPTRDVVRTYHGTSVSDPYEWLEGRDEAVRDWSRAQNAYARRQLDGLPGRAALTERLRALITASPDWYLPRWKGQRLFLLEARPPKQQPYLVMLAGPDPADARVVLDPNVLDATGGTSIDWFVPTDDATRVAVSLSEGGSESGTVHVYDTATGAEHARDVVPYVHGGTAGGDLAWTKDGSGFWYTRYPHPGERPPADLAFYQQAYFHRLGSDPETDVPSLTVDLPKIAEIVFERSDDGRWLVATVADGDGGDVLHFLLDTRAGAAWKRLARPEDRVKLARFAADNSLWLSSYRDAGRGALRRLDAKDLPREDALAQARVVVPEGEPAIERFRPTATRIYVIDSLGGPNGVRIFDAASGPARERALGNLPLAPNSGVNGMARLEGDDLLYRVQSFLEPPAWYHWDAKRGQARKTALAQRASASFDDAEVVRETCTSKDGTRVPLNIVRRKGTPLDGSNPALLSGYGGFDISLTPAFDETLRVFLDRGGVYALANLRGGGEFGDAWHRAGKLTLEQNVFDDFLACAHHLIDTGYTRPERLAIRGGSNGGLLVAAALTREPGLFRAVVAEVGLFDMLRYETWPNGVFNVPEFGSVTDEAQFRALHAYSPYHNVRPGQAYPATLFMTGENDPRVAPSQSRKMVARLQAASPTSTVLLRTSGNTGHSAGTPLDAQIEQAVDIWGFLFWQLGLGEVPKR
jgi:prolyl oligopeptidase